VLHHLPDPQAGFDALAGALAPGGGIGLMVYAPHGRSGVYPLQSAFGRLLKGAPEDRLKAAKAIFARLPEGHPFRSNPHLGDHEVSDAGFYDLLLHSQDRPFTITELDATLGRAGLAMTGTPNGHLYDPAPLVGDAAELSTSRRSTGCNWPRTCRGRSSSTWSTRRKRARRRIASRSRGRGWCRICAAWPRRRWRRRWRRRARIPVSSALGKTHVAAPKGLAPVLARIDGRSTLEEIAKAAGGDWFALAPSLGEIVGGADRLWRLMYSGLLRR
jgi:hypothetical protein